MKETTPPTLAIQPPESPIVNDAKKLFIDQTIKLDDLGPMVVNSDGTLSRIANWKSLTKEEQERTMRIIGARNKLRIANEERKQLQDHASGRSEDASGFTSTSKGSET